MSEVKGEMIEVIKQLTRLETKIDMMGNVRDVANDAMASAKSAHLRVDGLSEETGKRFEKVEKVHFWAATTVVGAVIVGAITLLFQLAKN